MLGIVIRVQDSPAEVNELKATLGHLYGAWFFFCFSPFHSVPAHLRNVSLSVSRSSFSRKSGKWCIEAIQSVRSYGGSKFHACESLKLNIYRKVKRWCLIPNTDSWHYCFIMSLIWRRVSLAAITCILFNIFLFSLNQRIVCVGNNT